MLSKHSPHALPVSDSGDSCFFVKRRTVFTLMNGPFLPTLLLIHLYPGPFFPDRFYPDRFYRDRSYPDRSYLDPKYCRKLTRLIKITYASKNLFTSARCSCDAVIPPSNSSSSFEVSAIFWDCNFDDICRNATNLWNCL